MASWSVHTFIETTRRGASSAARAGGTHAATASERARMARAMNTMHPRSELPRQAQIDRPARSAVAVSGGILLIEQILHCKFQIRALIDPVGRCQIDGDIVRKSDTADTELLVVTVAGVE